MASPSHCTRWHAIVCFTMSVVLAFSAAAITLRATASDATSASTTRGPVSHALSLTASRSLRRAGFHITATLLMISPELFLSAAANSTIFAIQDSRLSNASLPPHLLRSLLRYHTSPLWVSIDDLLAKPRGHCLPTLYRRKHIAVTKVDRDQRTVQINHVAVTHPNLFLEGSVSIHGVGGPFYDLGPEDDVIHAPVCDSNSTMVHDFHWLKKRDNNVEWARIVRLLSSNGFVSFSIGLHYVLDGILGDERGVDSVTVFVPPRLEIGGYPLPLLEKIVRFHIVPRRLTLSQLSKLPTRTLLRTMVHGQPLEVTGNLNFLEGGVVINGVKIVAPDLYSSNKFIVHGISRAFEAKDLPNTE